MVTPIVLTPFGDIMIQSSPGRDDYDANPIDSVKVKHAFCEGEIRNMWNSRFFRTLWCVKCPLVVHVERDVHGFDQLRERLAHLQPRVWPTKPAAGTRVQAAHLNGRIKFLEGGVINPDSSGSGYYYDTTQVFWVRWGKRHSDAWSDGTYVEAHHIVDLSIYGYIEIVEPREVPV